MAFGSGIKTVQQGTGTESVAHNTVDTVDIVITTTVLAKSTVKAWGTTPSGTYGLMTIAPVLIDTETLRLFMNNGNSASTKTVTYTWQVIEYY